MNVFKTNIFVSAVPKEGCRQLFDMEAKEALIKLGYSFVHVDDDGMCLGLDPQNNPIQGHRVYEKRVLEELKHVDSSISQNITP